MYTHLSICFTALVDNRCLPWFLSLFLCDMQRKLLNEASPCTTMPVQRFGKSSWQRRAQTFSSLLSNNFLLFPGCLVHPQHFTYLVSKSDYPMELVWILVYIRVFAAPYFPRHSSVSWWIIFFWPQGFVCFCLRPSLKCLLTALNLVLFSIL